MTKEEIEKIIRDALDLNKQDSVKLVEDLLKPTVDRLAALEKPQETPKTQDKASKPDKAESALDARVKDLEAKLKQAEELRVNQEKQASSLRFDSSLSSALDELKPLHKGVVQELFANRIKQDAVEKDGSWLTKDGKTIKEALSEFFGTDAGKHFLPSNHQDGAGTVESQPNRTTPVVDTVEALRQAFI